MSTLDNDAPSKLGVAEPDECPHNGKWTSMPLSHSSLSGHPAAVIAASASVFGSRTIPSEEIDREFGMELGKLRNRAGIVSISRAAAKENEITLGASAARAALEMAGTAPGSCDWLFTTSETHHSYPSLAAELHDQIRLRDSCGAMDIGGACLGLLHALETAQAFVRSGQARCILVVTSDVHSRVLTASKVRGEFGGLFGDGATAFVVQQASSTRQGIFTIGEMRFGCASQFAHAIRVEDQPDGRLDVVFEGEALSRAAISKLTQVVAELEDKCGISRAQVSGFATHQPNPRLVTLLAKQIGVPSDRFPAIAKNHGNLGSSTCAAALHKLLDSHRAPGTADQKTIFLASLGPGLLYGGGWITSVERA